MHVEEAFATLHFSIILISLRVKMAQILNLGDVLFILSAKKLIKIIWQHC